MKKLSLFSHLAFLDHGLATHPENRQRLIAIWDRLNGSPYHDLLDLSINRLATVEELAEVHDPSYIAYVLNLKGQEAELDPETPLTAGSVHVAQLAAGIGVEMVEKIVNGEIQSGFALLRPPGHHARPSAGMGFCIFNHIAIAAKNAIQKGVNRILILDWDVHHGNGTEEMFYLDDRVLVIDLHQDNLFPVGSGLIEGRGSGKGDGFTVNVPLPASSRDEDYLYVFDKLVKPMAIQYQPELVLVSAGFDAHESDPLGMMCLTTEGFGDLTGKIKSLAELLCGGKLALFLEGGYDPHCLAKNVLECVEVLGGGQDRSKKGDPHPSSEVEAVVEEVLKIHVA